MFRIVIVNIHRESTDHYWLGTNAVGDGMINQQLCRPVSAVRVKLPLSRLMLTLGDENISKPTKLHFRCVATGILLVDTQVKQMGSVLDQRFNYSG